jgi:hypothetical protein
MDVWWQPATERGAEYLDRLELATRALAQHLARIIRGEDGEYIKPSSMRSTEGRAVMGRLVSQFHQGAGQHVRDLFSLRAAPSEDLMKAWRTHGIGCVPIPTRAVGADREHLLENPHRVVSVTRVRRVE